jgi:hypothetical protein
MNWIKGHEDTDFNKYYDIAKESLNLPQSTNAILLFFVISEMVKECKIMMMMTKAS